VGFFARFGIEYMEVEISSRRLPEGAWIPFRYCVEEVVPMDRRRFVGALAAAPFLAWIGSLTARAAAGSTGNLPRTQFPNPGQGPDQFPEPQLPTASQDQLPTGPPKFPEVKFDRHAILLENQKNMRKDVNRLYDLAGKLKKQISQTDSSEVLSLDMIQTADEIQKLAKHIVDLAKG
jgi:hypothetical protein